MKKLFAVLLASVSIFCAGSLLAACGGDDKNSSDKTSETTQTPQDTLKNFTGISLSDKTVTYNGQAHSIAVSGEVPSGASVTYTGNGQTNAGEYTVSAKISKEGYNDLTLSAKLKINKARFTGITFEDKEVVANGSEQSITVSGILPAGTSVTYQNHKGTEKGTYNAVAILTNPNYETATLNATLTIKGKLEFAADAAKKIVDALIAKPDAWSFMPSALTPEKMAHTQAPVTDFTNFTNTAFISKKVIGKQLNVLYDCLDDTQTLLKYVDNVSTVGGAIASVYQNHLNTNPDNYKNFTGTAGGFTFTIELDGDKSKISVGNSAVSIALSYDSSTELRTGRIQVTSGAALKYEYSEDELKLAVKGTVSGTGVLRQLQFVRQGSSVASYMYEHLGTADKALKTSAVISVNSDYTSIMSNKRESDDLLINGYEEVYSSATGEFVGGEVEETIKTADYDTLWFNLGDVTGFNNVKVTNGTNKDTVYVNNAGTAFEVSKNSILGVATSRKFDIEMKEVWYIEKVTDGRDISYEKKKALIPMLFVQKDDAAVFGNAVKEKNPAEFPSAPVLPATKRQAVESRYPALKTLFDTIKQNVSYNDIVDYIG